MNESVIISLNLQIKSIVEEIRQKKMLLSELVLKREELKYLTQSPQKPVGELSPELVKNSVNSSRTTEDTHSHTGKPLNNLGCLSNPSIATSNVGVLDKSREMDTKQELNKEILNDYDYAMIEKDKEANCCC